MFKLKKIDEIILPHENKDALNELHDKKIKEANERFIQLKIIEAKNDYKKELESLKRKELLMVESKEVQKAINLFNNNIYEFASTYKVKFLLNKEEKNEIKDQLNIPVISINFKKINEYTNLEVLKEKEKIRIAYDKIIEELRKKYPPKAKKALLDTEESLEFESKYKNNIEAYVEDKNNCTKNAVSPLSNYAFCIVDKWGSDFFPSIKPIVEYDSRHYSYFFFDIEEKNINSNFVYMYNNSWLDEYYYFLFKNELYELHCDEHITDEQLLLRVKDILYTEDEKYKKLKQRIELYESNFDVEPRKSRAPISEEVKFEVWRRDEGKCVYCGSQENLEFDHIIPISRGGANTTRNIQLLCQSCNRKKSDKI